MKVVSLRKRGFRKSGPANLDVSRDRRISKTSSVVISRSDKVFCRLIVDGCLVEESLIFYVCIRNHETVLLCDCLVLVFCRHVKTHTFLAHSLRQYFVIYLQLSSTFSVT